MAPAKDDGFVRVRTRDLASVVERALDSTGKLSSVTHITAQVCIAEVALR